MLSINYFNDLLHSLRSQLTGKISPGLFYILLYNFVYFYNTFQYLYKVAFSLQMENTNNKQDIFIQGNIVKLVAAAEELEKLTFDFNYKVDNIPLEKYLGSFTWPCLQSI